MPELPDVERLRLLLQGNVVGKRIEAVEVCDEGVVRGRSSENFVHQLDGRRFREPKRRGKWLLAPTDGLTILFHFGMTGTLVWESADQGHQRYDRVVIHVGPRKLVFRDQRKLQGIWLADGEDDIAKVTGDLGPDALGIPRPLLEEQLQGRRGALKAVLMDQRTLAGLGNMLCDEVLWRARIHPARRFDDLEPLERKDLARNLQRVLQSSVKIGSIPRRATWLSSQRSRPDPNCPRCRELLETSRIGGRTTYWCPTCQPNARLSAGAV